jgi:hypothetical protein
VTHEVGDLEGEHAGEHVDSDVVLGPVVHGRERDYVAVFELAFKPWLAGSRRLA